MGLREKNGKWEYRFAIKGQLVTAGTGLEATERNRKKAEEREAVHRAEIREGRWGIRPLKPRTFISATEEFSAWCRIEYRDKPNSWRRVETSMASCRVFFGSQMVSMIAPGDVERYKVWRAVGDEQYDKVRDVTIKHDLDNLSVFFRWAVKSDYARQNPVREVRKPSDSAAKRERILTEAEERLYFQMCLAKFTLGKHKRGPFQDLHDLGRLMILQGCRPEEVQVIEKAHVNIQAGQLLIPKGKTAAARRALRLTDEALSILGRRMSGDSRWVFPSPKKPGCPITKLNNSHNVVCDKISVQFVLYDLRHTFATRMIEAGASDWALAKIMGHSTTRVLHRYVHPTQKSQDDAMQAYNVLNEARQKGIVQ